MTSVAVHTTHFTGKKIPHNLKPLTCFADGTELLKCTNSIFVLCKDRDALDLGGKAQGLLHIEQRGRHIPLTILVSAEVSKAAFSSYTN